MGSGFQKVGRWKLVAKQKVAQMWAFTTRKSVCLRGQFPSGKINFKAIGNGYSESSLQSGS